MTNQANPSEMLPPIMLEDGSRPKEFGEFTTEDLRRVAYAVQRRPRADPASGPPISPVVTRDVPAPTSNGGVYFVGAETGPVKIGITADFIRRLAGLQAASPVRLRILAVVDGASPQIERNYHERFAEYRLHGEWFERCLEIEAEIARLTK